MDLTQAFSDSGGGFMDMLGKLFTGGGGGGGGQQDSGGGGILAPLLLGGGSMLASKLLGAGDQKNIDKATKQLRGIGGTATGAGTQLVNRGAAGKLTDAQQARVDRMKAEQNAGWAQRFADMGIPMSTMATQATNLVDTQAEELAGKLINDSFQQGIAALNLGSSSSQALLSSAAQQKADLAKTIGEIAKQIGLVMNQPRRGEPGSVQQQAQTATQSWGDPYVDVPIQEETIQ